MFGGRPFGEQGGYDDRLKNVFFVFFFFSGMYLFFVLLLELYYLYHGFSVCLSLFCFVLVVPRDHGLDCGIRRPIKSIAWCLLGIGETGAYRRCAVLGQGQLDPRASSGYR